MPDTHTCNCGANEVCSNCPHEEDLEAVITDLTIDAVIQALETLRTIASSGSDETAVEASRAILDFVALTGVEC